MVNSKPPAKEPIVIVGMGGVFPEARNVDEFWNNIVQGIDTTIDVPQERWAIDKSFSLARKDKDRVASGRACLIRQPITVDTSELQLQAEDLEGLDPVFLLALESSRQAFFDSCSHQVDPTKFGVIMAAIALPTEETSKLTEGYFRGVAEANAFGYGEPGEVSTHPYNLHAVGRPASLVAQALNIQGGAYTLDAACASSLYALKLACDELHSGRLDAVLAGGVSRPDCLYTQMGFTALGALSSTGQCSPFDTKGNGLVVGEGAGMVVLKRLSDALEHGDTIHAVLQGIGLSNDMGGSLLAPDTQGQLRAMRQAYREADWKPDTVQFIECHGTGTPMGDRVEVKTLQTFWQEHNSTAPCSLGSVKSMIGHLLTAAGAAGLIKVVLGMKHKTIPPMLNFEQPAKGLLDPKNTFNFPTHPEPWNTQGLPRRAAVSAFGFGGINAHVLVEEWQPEATTSTKPNPTFSSDEPLAIVGVAGHIGTSSTWQDFFTQLSQAVVPPARPESRWNYIHEYLPIDDKDPLGYFLQQLDFPIGSVRIPPKDIPKTLPQQLLMLQVAHQVAEDAGLESGHKERGGALIGIQLDLNTTNYNLRWSLERNLPDNHGLTPEQLEEVRDSLSEPLDAARTLGALGSIVASRVARELHLGGPSYAVSAEESSGLYALHIAAQALRRKELDFCVIGAVDLGGDPRNTTYQNPQQEDQQCEGAIAMVVKRLRDAEEQGDKIYAVINDIQLAPPGRKHKSPLVSQKSVRESWGYSSALEGLATLSSGVHQLASRTRPNQAQNWSYWLRNRIDQTRQLTVVSQTDRDIQFAVSMEQGPKQLLYPTELPAQILTFTGSSLTELQQNLKKLSEQLPEWSYLGQHTYQACDPKAPYRLALVLTKPSQIFETLERAQRIVAQGVASKGEQGIFFQPQPSQDLGKMAFVYPGSGNHYPQMAEQLSAAFPDIWEEFDLKTQKLKSHWHPSTKKSDPHRPIFSQVNFGIFMTAVLERFGVVPDGVIGYSLGESTSLFASKAWLDRDECFENTIASQLFSHQLGGPCLAARKQLGIDPSAKFHWSVAVVNQSPDKVRQLISSYDDVWLLIVNTANQCVIGGQASSVQTLCSQVDLAFELDGVPTVHCPVVNHVSQAYFDLHNMDINPEAQFDFYSCAWGKKYTLTSTNAAQSILDQALHGFAFPQVIQAAHQDGYRQFLEIGPRASCSRALESILAPQDRTLYQANPVSHDEVTGLLRCLANLFAHHHPNLDLGPLWSQLTPKVISDKPTVTLQVGHSLPHRIDSVSHQQHRGKPRHNVSLELASKSMPSQEIILTEVPQTVESPSLETTTTPHQTKGAQLMSQDYNSILQSLVNNSQLTLEAHQQFLEQQEEWIRQIHQIGSSLEGMTAVPLAPNSPYAPTWSEENRPAPLSDEPAIWDRSMCMEFAVGSVAKVLGPEFAEVDNYPVRVRLPDTPLMLCDRIMAVEGEPGSLGSGRLITEHDVHPGSWYLDADRTPVFVSVEAGQADLFLSSYLGIDLAVKGTRAYRLLDATVQFHRGLPRPGEIIRYDIRISHFIRQGDIYLFFFEYDGTINGQPLITMRNGCAGFFTEEEIANSGGIVQTAEDKKPVPGVIQPGYQHLITLPQHNEHYDDAQVEAFRNGHIDQCFGAPFSNLNLHRPYSLPTGRLRLFDRILELNCFGGRYGLGTITSEADIHPDDWFLTCHFVDDMVMPGTLMYECCAHTLRFLLARMGWVGEESIVAFEPVQNVPAALKCRGPVNVRTQKVTYQVDIKEIGYNPAPYVIADAIMHGDGEAIVQFKDMSMQLTGLTKESLQQAWNLPESLEAIPEPIKPAYNRRPAIYDKASIMEYSNGRPSVAFGPEYKVFDDQRRIARLPGPPYQFVDRIVEINDQPPFVLQPGGWVVAEYDIPEDAWYFFANHQTSMAYAILLEAALQPCGWLAAYCGSALRSDKDLHFRNLGGTATLVQEIYPTSGTLTMKTRLTNTSEAGGMIIEHFDMEMYLGDTLVYEGTTNFGFFSAEALANQLGVRDAHKRQFIPTEADKAQHKPLTLPRLEPIFPVDSVGQPEAVGLNLPGKALMMMDQVDLYLPEGAQGLGYIAGSKTVDPDEWFFKAHFYQDPVWPGSLGLEAMLQLIRAVAMDKFPDLIATHRFEPIVVGEPHTWAYRGQVTPRNKHVEVCVQITEVRQGDNPVIKGHGFLIVDGLPIYEMTDFGLRMVRG